MSKLKIITTWLIGLKHRQGEHNQKRHGWRYGSLEGARRALRAGVSDDYASKPIIEREEYRKRAGMTSLSPTEAEFKGAQERIQAARNGLAAAHDKIEEAEREGKAYEDWRKEYSRLNYKQGDLQDKYNKTLYKIYDEQDRLSGQSRELERLHSRGLATAAQVNEVRLKLAQLNERDYYSDFLTYSQIPIAGTHPLIKKRNKLEGEVNATIKEIGELAKLRPPESQEYSARSAYEVAKSQYTKITEKDTATAMRYLEIKGRNLASQYATERTPQLRKLNAKKEEIVKTFEEIQRLGHDVFMNGENPVTSAKLDQAHAKHNKLIDEIEGLLHSGTGGTASGGASPVVSNPSKFDVAYERDANPKDYQNEITMFQRMTSSNPLYNKVTIDKDSEFYGRANYSHNTVSLFKVNYGGTVVHELGHWIEDRDPIIRQQANKFLERRTRGEKPQYLNEIEKNKGYDNSEVSTPDKFMEAYIGKRYTLNHTEVISMGLQLFFENPVKFARSDPDMFAFIYAIVRLGGEI